MVAQRRIPVDTQPTLLASPPDEPRSIRLPSDWELSDERFLEIGRLNPDQLFERTADGRLLLVTWPDGLSAAITTRIAAFVSLWAMNAGGEAFGGDRGYFLPDRSGRAPDVSWIDDEQIAERGGLRGQFRFAPRFVVEVSSPSQQLDSQQEKMRAWMSNGVQLGWLVDPYEETVRIYRADGSEEQLQRPLELSGEAVCSGLKVDMSQVWEQR